MGNTPSSEESPRRLPHKLNKARRKEVDPHDPAEWTGAGPRPHDSCSHFLDIPAAGPRPIDFPGIANAVTAPKTERVFENAPNPLLPERISKHPLREWASPSQGVSPDEALQQRRFEHPEHTGGDHFDYQRPGLAYSTNETSWSGECTIKSEADMSDQASHPTIPDGSMLPEATIEAAAFTSEPPPLSPVQPFPHSRMNDRRGRLASHPVLDRGARPKSMVVLPTSMIRTPPISVEEPRRWKSKSITPRQAVARHHSMPVVFSGGSGVRAETPDETDYRQLGAIKFGSLHITNGPPSPCRDVAGATPADKARKILDLDAIQRGSAGQSPPKGKPRPLSAVVQGGLPSRSQTDILRPQSFLLRPQQLPRASGTPAPSPSGEAPLSQVDEAQTKLPFSRTFRSKLPHNDSGYSSMSSASGHASSSFSSGKGSKQCSQADLFSATLDTQSHQGFNPTDTHGETWGSTAETAAEEDADRGRRRSFTNITKQIRSLTRSRSRGARGNVVQDSVEPEADTKTGRRLLKKRRKSLPNNAFLWDPQEPIPAIPKDMEMMIQPPVATEVESPSRPLDMGKILTSDKREASKDVKTGSSMVVENHDQKSMPSVSGASSHGRSRSASFRRSLSLKGRRPRLGSVGKLTFSRNQDSDEYQEFQADEEIDASQADDMDATQHAVGHSAFDQAFEAMGQFAEFAPVASSRRQARHAHRNTTEQFEARPWPWTSAPVLGTSSVGRTTDPPFGMDAAPLPRPVRAPPPISMQTRRGPGMRTSQPPPRSHHGPPYSQSQSARPPALRRDSLQGSNRLPRHGLRDYNTPRHSQHRDAKGFDKVGHVQHHQSRPLWRLSSTIPEDALVHHSRGRSVTHGPPVPLHNITKGSRRVCGYDLPPGCDRQNYHQHPTAL